MRLIKLLKGSRGGDWLLGRNGRVSLHRQRNYADMENYETNTKNLNRLDKLLIEVI